METQTKKWTKILDNYYVKFPVLPKGADEFIVSVAPWLALVFGILAILGGISAFGFGSFLTPYAAMFGPGGYAAFLLSSLVILAEGVLMLWAFSSLRKRALKGWNLMFWTLVLSILSSVVSLSVYSIVSSVIGALIGYYFLYQVKSYYK